MADWVVVGAGMRGIVASSRLARSGASVTLVDAGGGVGGVLRSDEWDGLFVDRGCHLFDFGHEATGVLVSAILGEELYPVQRRYAAICRGVRSDGIAVPDMSAFPAEERQRALADLRAVQARCGRGEAATFDEMLSARFGASAGRFAAGCTRAMCGYSPEELGPEAGDALPMLARLRLGPDREMEALKRDPWFDARLAVSSEADPLRFHRAVTRFSHRNYYPRAHGMRGFCDAAEAYLRRVGVRLAFGHAPRSLGVRAGGVSLNTSGGSIDAARCYWALSLPRLGALVGAPSLDDAAAVSRPVAVALFAYRVRPEDVGPYTYVHDYDGGSALFRASAPGAYGRQIDASGLTYVCGEVPMARRAVDGFSAGAAAGTVWDELVATGVVAHGSRYRSVRTAVVPSAFELPGPGWSTVMATLAGEIPGLGERIAAADPLAFGKGAILDSVAADLAEHVREEVR